MKIGKEADVALKRIDGIPDDDWQGMYNVAAKRAVVAEAEVRSLQTALAALKARDIRICLHCGREQEGVK
jgi:hypothetical protein